MLRTIHLHGRLKHGFDPHYEIDAQTPGEAVRALLHMVPGFEQALRSGTWRVIAGDRKTGRRLGEDEVKLPFMGRKERTLHIVPAVAGAGRGGGGKVIMGIALIAIAIAAPYAIGAAGLGLAPGAGFGAMMGAAIPGTFGLVSFKGVAMLGAMMALGGITQLLSPQPKTNYDNREKADDNSALYNGPVNTSEQGGPVPLIYGTMIVGSKSIAMGINPEDMPVDVAGNDDPEESNFWGVVRSTT